MDIFLSGIIFRHQVLFVRFGYNMDQFNDLVTYYYNNLNSTNDVYGTGVANNTSVESDNVIRVKNNSGSYVPLVAFQSDGSVKTVSNRALAYGSI